MGSHDAAPWTVGAGWMEAALGATSDLVVVIDPTATIVWCNDSALPLLGIEPAAAIGRSLAEFVHPTDLTRAVEVVTLVAGGAFDASPITPALYRIGSEATGWVELEINASEGPDGSLLVVGRPGGDLVITDRLLEAVTGREPFHRQAELVLELGRWRYPIDGYVLRYVDEDGVERRITAGAPAPEPLGGPDAPTPWEAARSAGDEVAVADLRDVGPGHQVVGEALARGAIAAGFVGCLAARVHDPAHEAGAVITIWTSADGPTTAGHRYAMHTMCRALALVLQQRAQVHELERASRVDQLTGAMSRVRFLEVIDQIHGVASPSAQHAVLYVDLDGFKAVNDGHGHSAGDEVLRVAVQRIVDAAPEGSIVARLGGDEFVVLCPVLADTDEALTAAARITDAMGAPIEMRAGTVAVGASVGVAVSSEGVHLRHALDAADAALLAAKADGKGRWHLAPRG